MKKEDILDWMDKQIDIKRFLIDSRVLGKDIEAVYESPEIQIYRGIEKCAEAANMLCIAEVEKGEDVPYPIRKSFIYRNTEFFQLLEEECSS